MKLSALLTYLGDEGTMPESWGCVVLVRDRKQASDSDRAYRILPVVDVRGDSGGHAVEIVVAEPSGTRRAPELKAREAAARLKRLAPTHAAARVFAAHPGCHDHVRISGATADPELDALAFLEWFKGIEAEL